MKSNNLLMILFLSLAFFISINTSITENKSKNDDDLIDISKGYTHVNPSDRTYFYIAILSTSDIHGHFYPEEYEINGINYSQGGLDYLSKYINILNNEFPNRFLYVDAGDLFQGGTESLLTDGEIMTDSLNLMKCNAAAFGDCEFHYSRNFLEEKVSKSTFHYLSTNIYDKIKQSKNAFGSNHFTSKIYTINVTDSYMDNIKVGIVGLSRQMTRNELSGDGYDNIEFLSYRDELISEANKLRKEGCHTVLLLTHIGLSCGTEKNMNLNMYTSKSEQDLCDTGSELYQLLLSLDKDVIDGVITGHYHQQIHHWINDIPVIASIAQGFYANILYIPFKWSAAKQIYEIYKSKIQIEGPIPICEKIFEKTGKCDYIKPSLIENYLPLVEYKFHGVKIEKDNNLSPIHQKYDEKFEVYREKVCDIIGTEEKMTISENGDFYIGNIISEIQGRITGADISILGYENLKSYWNPGKLIKYKIKDLIPIESNLCTFVMTGNEVKKMMNILQTGEKKYYSTYGIKQTMSRNEDGKYYLSDVKLFDGYQETELIEEKEYLISAIKNLIVEGGSDFSKVLSWYTPRQLNCDYGDIDELIEKYLKAQKVVDVTKYKDENNPRIKFID